MLVCSPVEVWSASRQPAPQVAQPKHLLCESCVGGCEVCLPCRPLRKKETKSTPMLYCDTCLFMCSHQRPAPLFCVWASDAMPRLCPLCAHRKLLAVPGISRADFPIPYQGLRCYSNLLASIFIHKSRGSPSLSHTLSPDCQPFPRHQGGHRWWVANHWLQLVHSQAGIPHQLHYTPLHSHFLIWGYQTRYHTLTFHFKPFYKWHSCSVVE